MFKVPLLFQVRLPPRTPPVTLETDPACVVNVVEVTLPSIVPKDQFKMPPEAMVIAPAPVSVPPLIVVVPLNTEDDDKFRELADKVPGNKVKLPSLVTALAACPALETVTVPAPDPM